MVPDDPQWVSFVSGALIELTYRQNWEKFGLMTPEEAAAAAELILDSWLTQKGNHMVGEIVMGAWAIAPYGFLLCDGAQYLRDDYPELYFAIHGNYVLELGPDPSFKVPDLRGRVPRGVGHALPLSLVVDGEEDGHELKTLGVNEMPSHYHTYFKPGLNIDLEAPGVPDIFGGGIGVPDITGSSGGGEAFSILNPYAGVQFYIVAKVR